MVLPGPAPHTPSRADLRVAVHTPPGVRGSSDSLLHQLMTMCFPLWLWPLLSHGQHRAVLAECPLGLQWDDVSSQASPALPWLTQELRTCSHIAPGPSKVLGPQSLCPHSPGNTSGPSKSLGPSPSLPTAWVMPQAPAKSLAHSPSLPMPWLNGS